MRERLCRRAPDAAPSAGHGFQYAVPSRANSNQLYIKELDRIVLKDNLTSRDFNDQSQARFGV